MSHLNEGVIDVCDCCDGSGKIEWAYHANSPEPDGVRECGHCNGEGFVLVDAEQADEDWIAEPGSACREASCGHCGRCT